MARIRNKSTVPSGMLNPAGLVDTFVDPSVQSTTRPPGSILQPSPGYDSVRVGKNIFQGKGPTGGFRPMEFAEEVGATGAAMSAIPGDTAQLAETEWLPENRDSMIIADRELRPGWASILHGGQNTIPDMGDRSANRPLSKAWFARLNPSNVLRAEYQKSPAVSVAMGAGLVYVVYLLGSEIERNVKRPRGIGTAVTSVPAAGAQASGDVASDAIDKIGEAGDKAVKAIEDATDKAVDAIGDATKTAKETVTE